MRNYLVKGMVTQWCSLDQGIRTVSKGRFETGYLDHSNHLANQLPYSLLWNARRQMILSCGYGEKRQPLSVSCSESIILAQLLEDGPTVKSGKSCPRSSRWYWWYLARLSRALFQDPWNTRHLAPVVKRLRKFHPDQRFYQQVGDQNRWIQKYSDNQIQLFINQ